MDDVARVVLALDAPQVAEEVLHYLDRSGLARVVGTAADDRQLGDALRQLQPDVVVAQPSLGAAARGVAVLALDARESVAGLRAALDAGAKAFFVWPSDRERLLGTIARSGFLDRRASRGRIIAVRGARGGVGATFVATHLAAQLTRSSGGCILVDGDLLAGDLGAALGAPADEVKTFGDVLPFAHDVTPLQVEAALWPHPSGVRVLLGPEPEDSRVSGQDFAAVVDAAAGLDAIVVIHLGKALDDVALAAVRAADRIVHVLGLDVASFRAADRAVHVLAGLHPVGTSGFVVNRARRGEIVPDDVRRVFGVDALVVLPSDREVARAQGRGRLIEGRGRIARAFRRLAERLDDELPEGPTEAGEEAA
jgi:pilus assembly protein CpaE